MMWMKSKSVLLALPIVAVSGAGLGYILGPRIGVALTQPAPTGIAYVLETEQRFVSDAGVPGPVMRRAIAHRADGQRSMTFYYLRPDGKTYATRRILDPHTGKLTQVHYDIETKVTEYLPETHAERYGKVLAAPDAECLAPLAGSYSSPRIVGRSQIEGVPVLEIAYEDVTGQSVEWRAPSLNCDILKEDRRVVNQREEATGRVTRVTTKLVIGEPAAEFFEIPEFQERSPLGSVRP